MFNYFFDKEIKVMKAIIILIIVSQWKPMSIFLIE